MTVVYHKRSDGPPPARVRRVANCTAIILNLVHFFVLLFRYTKLFKSFHPSKAWFAICMRSLRTVFIVVCVSLIEAAHSTSLHNKRVYKIIVLVDLLCKLIYQPIAGAFRAIGVDLAVAKSSGKLCAFLSCITSIPRPARLSTSAQVLITLF